MLDFHYNYNQNQILFLSKAHNLNNFLQSRTMLRVWINFSDYHKVHRLFGIIVGIETCSHSFFHILRWAYRKDDIQVCASMCAIYLELRQLHSFRST